MKKLFKFACALLAGVAMFACNDPVEEEIKFCTEITTNVSELAQFAAENATEQTVEVTADGQWMAVAPAWLEVKPNVGYAGKTVVTVKAADNKEEVEKDGQTVTELGPQRSAEITFAGEGDAKAVVAVSQAGDPNKWDPAKPRPVTMQYFNEVATTGDGFTYELTGKITEVANTLYGNFYFEDETGSVYVYGLLSPEGEQKVQWAAAGLKVNDVLTVRGARGEYGGSPQMANATYVSHVVGEDEPVITTTIGGIEKPGQYIVEEAQVLATYARGFLAGDETGKILVYLNKEAEVAVGDKVKLEGTTTTYAGLLQFGNDTVVTKVGEGTVEHGEPVVMDVAALEAYVETPVIQYASYTGTLSITENDKGSKYYNVIFEDTENVQGSISYPTMDLTAYDGKKIVVTGYTIGCSSGKFVNTMVVEVSEPVKVETNFGEKTYEFLKAVVDGKMLGDATPEIEDWSAVTAEFPGITMAEVDGKLEITSINAGSFTALPSTISLPELTYFHGGENKNFNGKEFPAVWNTPKLEYVNIAVCGFTGTFPKSFAENTPAMHTLFMNDNQFKGAWPHTWASGVNGGTGKLECLISIPGNDKMGYMVPATMDVKLNKWKNDDQSQGHDNPSRDKTQIKIAGADAETVQYIGFEKGWGQERYVKYGNGAADDLTTWHAKRLLCEEEWEWYFSNLPGKIPTAMYTWDQAAADAYTANGTLPNPDVDDSVTIAEIIEKGAGEYEVKDATVVAVTTKGILLNDGTGYIYNYINKTPEYVVGDIVRIKGEVEIRYEMHQFKSSATSEKTGHNDSFAQPTPEVIDAAKLDAYMSAPVYKYVEVTGVIEAGQYTNLVVEGTENTVSPSTYGDMAGLKALNGHSVTMKGYLAGSNTSSKYASIYIVEYTDNGLVVEPEVGGEITEYGTYVWTMASGDIAAGELVKGEPKITWTSTDAPYIGWDSNDTAKGIQIGSGSKPANSFVLSTEAVKVNIKEIIVNASIAKGGDGTLTVKVGDKVCLDGQALTTTATDYTVAVGATGKVEISLSATAKAMYIKSITIVTAEGEPAKPKVQMGEGTKAFLKAIVDGQMMGDSTPAVEDWDYFAAEFPGITIADVNGKLEVTRISGGSLTALPNVVELPELTWFSINGNANFNGKSLPATWNTPKITTINIAWCHMVGTIPAGFAATPELHTLFMDNNDFHGAWPHNWASGVNGGTGKLEVVIANGGNDGMGYMVPATLDVKLNAWKNSADHSQGNNNANGDLTQIKLGGAEANPAKYVGFEKGWGQERYVTFAGGSASDKTTWHEKRGLAGNPDEWAWYFTNLPGTIPQVMLDWDQAAADAFTASGVLPDLSEPENPEEGGEHEGFGGNGGGEATATDYTMTLTATAGVISTNISGLPSSWKESDTTWTATDDSGKDTITFTGNVYYSNSESKNIVWYFNKTKAETHVSAADMGTVKKVTLYPNSDRKPQYFTCKAGETVVTAVEAADKNSATITYDFTAAGVTADNFRLDFAETGTNVECGKIVIEYAK
ncbi:MAG: hypothetical protein E7134_02675 [Rikenellaceae bacterium]|nr:hypothetical protein [Rikenellaceae bacterium]